MGDGGVKQVEITIFRRQKPRKPGPQRFTSCSSNGKSVWTGFAN